MKLKCFPTMDPNSREIARRWEETNREGKTASKYKFVCHLSTHKYKKRIINLNGEIKEMDIDELRFILSELEQM